MSINRTSFEERARLSAVLLDNIKANLPAVEELAARFERDEADLFYRFYHWSFKVFSRQAAVRQGLELFKLVAPEGRQLNGWYTGIVDAGLAQHFDNARTNDNWVGEVLPVLTAWSHTQVFLKNMLRAGRELQASGHVLEDYWALVLYLYDCR